MFFESSREPPLQAQRLSPKTPSASADTAYPPVQLRPHPHIRYLHTCRPDTLEKYGLYKSKSPPLIPRCRLPAQNVNKGEQTHVPLDEYNNTNLLEGWKTPSFPAATGLGLISSDKENVGGGSTNAESTNALALEREARSVPPPIVHFFNHPSLVKRQSTVSKPTAPAVATPRPLSNSQLINSNDNNSLDNRAYVNAFDLIMRHRNGLGISVGDGTRAMEMMNGSTAMHSGSGEDEKLLIGKMDKPVDEVSSSS